MGLFDFFKRKSAEDSFLCACCGLRHDGIPFHYATAAPDIALAIPRDEWSGRVDADNETCVIEGQYFFVRGRLVLPVIDGDEDFSWDIWVSLSEPNFKRTIDLWRTPGRENEPPYFGWISSSLLLYPDTINLRSQVHTQPVGTRPYIELEHTDHPLAQEQFHGITVARVHQIARLIQERQGSGL